MERFVNTLGADSVGGIGSPMAGIRTFPDEDSIYNRARSLGRSSRQSISDKRVFHEQVRFREGFKARMSGLVEFMQEYWVYEREYWEKKKQGV